MTDKWTDRLSDYLDDELTPAERTQIEAHLAGCAACSATLTELQQIVARARSLPPVPPQSDLWQGIAQRITAQTSTPIERDEIPSQEGVVELRQFANQKKLRLSFSVPQLMAAGVVLMLVSGASVFLALRTSSGGRGQTATLPTVSGPVAAATRDTTPAAPAATPTQQQPAQEQPTQEQQVAVAPRIETTQPTRSAADHQKRANAAQVKTVSTEKNYDDAVSDLQKVLQGNRRGLDPKTVRALEDNLRLIDKAIADARKALESDSTNMYLNEHLADNMHRKLDLLRRASDIVSGRS